MLAALAVAGGTVTLLFGHVLLTSSLDLVVWPLVCLLVLRAVLREEQRWWVWTGLVVGLSTWNKLLVAMLLVALAVGLVATGRGRVLLGRGVVAGGLLAARARGPEPGVPGDARLAPAGDGCRARRRATPTRSG